MSEVTLSLSERDAEILRLVLSDARNKKEIIKQLSPEANNLLSSALSEAVVDLDKVTDLRTAINATCFLDRSDYYRWGHQNYISWHEFFTKLHLKNPNLFKELAEFVFLPASKRTFEGSNSYEFSTDIREVIADISVEVGAYIKSVILHYFKLYAQNGSSQQYSRINTWLKMPQVNMNHELISLLARSKKPKVLVFAINHADKSLYGFLVSDVRTDFGKWYLQRKMLDSSFGEEEEEDYLWTRKIEEAYQKDTGKKVNLFLG